MDKKYWVQGLGQWAVHSRMVRTHGPSNRPLVRGPWAQGPLDKRFKIITIKFEMLGPRQHVFCHPPLTVIYLWSLFMRAKNKIILGATAFSSDDIVLFAIVDLIGIGRFELASFKVHLNAG